MSEFWVNQEIMKECPLLLGALRRSQSCKRSSGERVYMDIMAAWKKSEDVFSTQLISFLEEKPAAILGVELYDRDSGLLLGTDYINSENICMMEGLAHFADVIPKKQKNSIYQKVHYMWLEPDGTVKTGDREQEFEFLDGQIVHSTTVSAPRAKNRKQTIVLYGREPFQGETEDYKYGNNHEAGGRVKAIMPVRGEVLFEDDIEIVEVCFDEANKPTLQLLFETGDQPVFYDGDYEKAFRKEGQKVIFDFDEDWNAEIDVRRFKASTVVNLHLAFKVKVLWKNMHYAVGIVVKSLDNTEADTPTVAIIEPISIRWGCLAKDTMITMKDGSQKIISDIRIGDIVRTPNGCSRVTEVYQGYEEEMVCLETSGHKGLRATGSHPLQTSRGMLTARELHAADRLLVQGGAYEQLTTLCVLPYQETVYNLLLESENAFYANGILVGDNEKQNSIGGDICRQWPQEVLKLKRDMRVLGEKLGGAALSGQVAR